MIKKCFIWCLIFKVLILTLPGSANGGQQEIEKIYRITKNRVLKLNFPLDWKDDIAPATDNSSYTIKLNPSSFVVTTRAVINVFWDTKGEKKFNNAEQVKLKLEKKGKRLLENAVQSRLNLKEIKGKTSLGYYYLLTDKAPKPGGYKFIIQGGLGVGNLLIMYTIFSNEKYSEFSTLILKMVTTAEQLDRR